MPESIRSEKEKNLKFEPLFLPMPAWWAAFYFGLPAILFYYCYHTVMPRLVSAGRDPLTAFLLSMGFPFGVMLMTSFWSYWRDGYKMTRSDLVERMRLKSLSQDDVLWGLGTGLFMTVTYVLFSYLISLFLHNTLFELPVGTPGFLQPLANVERATGSLLIGVGVVLLLKVLGEEFWCRGYLLPRQEKADKRLGWLWNGLLWLAFYAFAWWLIPALLPGALALAWVTAHRDNTTIGLLAHGLFAVGLVFIAFLG